MAGPSRMPRPGADADMAQRLADATYGFYTGTGTGTGTEA